ncbi:ABC transporter permease [Cellulomonas fengjieae]|uniref:Transport permease protein n=1 Tax=Cellulomonas fengjieae TaxID=2819978 RepID=A0ABS3SBK5_9CELL|nr:ABC transporter permease [Cellulomonas fengjieae]MBO3083130.1 ABC transporter permease [Cellulomonas fengjieae]MBO3102123.1 ABC transporter permease [Cellulomonas fengjieae]QVI65505.1 ABC transporter permease [Cellulomonas fengjieae]
MSSTMSSTVSRTTSSTSALTRLTAVEARLLLREPSAAFFVALFPAVLLTVLGLVMPWADLPFNDQDPILSQINGITGYAPTVLALAVATVALSSYPTTVAGYRGRGVLKRLSTTPVPPSRILVAQLAVNLGALLVAAVLMYVLGTTVVDVAAPADPLVLLLAFVLAVLSAFAVGSVIAALAPTAAAATAWGMALYFTSLFFAGVWLPLPLMPDVVQTIAGYTPLGAGSEALAAAWYGQPFPTSALLVMVAWTAVGVPVAARFFRWS